MKIKLCDTHNDYLTELPLEEIERYAKDNKDILVCASYWSTRKEEEEIEKDLELRVRHLRKANTCHRVHIEDMCWIKNKECLNNLIKLKPFSCSLTWNDKNCLASGSRAQGGLTTWGTFCIEKLMENNIVLDTAHLNRQSFFEMSNIIKKNIYCSHTGFYGVKRHKRNLTDKQIDRIVSSGGYIGLFFYDGCLKRKDTKSFTLQDIATSIDYFTSRWGYDNIGFGTDFYGVDNYPQGLESYEDFSKLRNLLKEKEYTDLAIDKLFYKNFVSFCRKIYKN